jgi:hypothetical protein
VFLNCPFFIAASVSFIVYCKLKITDLCILPVISRYPIKWKHESTVEVNWKSDEMNFPPNMPVNVDLYYPKVGDLFGIFGCVFFV